MIFPHGRLVFLEPKGRAAGEGVGERVPARGEGLGDAAAGAEGDVEDPDGGVGEFLDGVDAVALARDDFDSSLPIVDGYGRNFLRTQVAVAGLDGFELLRQIDPELDADVRAAVSVRAGHFRVHDPPAGSHELEVTGFDGAGVAGEVFVVDGAVEHVGDCFLATVGVVREASAGGDGGVVEH